MGTRLRIAGQIFTLKMTNPWAYVGMQRKAPPILMNITEMKKKLERHESVRRVWDAFTEVAGQGVPPECAGLEGMEKLACRAKYIGRRLRK